VDLTAEVLGIEKQALARKLYEDKSALTKRQKNEEQPMEQPSKGEITKTDLI
jgi:hypothetical protein